MPIIIAIFFLMSSSGRHLHLPDKLGSMKELKNDSARWELNITLHSTIVGLLGRPWQVE